MIYTLFNVTTGMWDSCLSLEGGALADVGLNVPDDCLAFPGEYSRDAHYLGLSGEVEQLPSPPPSSDMIFDRTSLEWFDPRSDADQLAAAVALRPVTVEAINAVRGRARERFITIAPGQDMVYIEKERAAQAWMAAFEETGAEPPAEDHPTIASEVGPGLTGSTAYEVAQIILNMANQWRYVSPLIERVVLTFINRAETSESVTELRALPRECAAEMGSALQEYGQTFP